MLVYGKCECFVMQVLYVCVLCAVLFIIYINSLPNSVTNYIKLLANDR